MSNFYLEDDSRLAVMSFMAIGDDAEMCLRAVMRDIDALPKKLSPNLARFVGRFLYPSADIAFLLLSSREPISSEKFLAVCERSYWNDPSSVRGYQQVRIAFLSHGALLQADALEQLLSAGFSIIEAFPRHDPFLSMRAAVTGIVGTMWTRSPIGTDFADLVTLFCQHGGMRGTLNFGSLREVELAICNDTPACNGAGSLFAIALCDESLSSDQFDEACAIAGDGLSDDWDAKVSLVMLPPLHPLLGASNIQLCLLRAHAVDKCELPF